MNLKIDEVLGSYANLLYDASESKSECLWHSSVEMPDAVPDLDVGDISFQTNVITSTAADKEKLEVLREKLSPFDKQTDMVEAAHQKPVHVADAMSDGGLVENQNELHEKLVQMINKYPSGSTGHKYADLLSDLVKVAQELDDAGDSTSANLVDRTAAEITELLKKNSSLAKTAWVGQVITWTPRIIKGLAGLAAAGGASWWALKGRQENLKVDLGKLAGNIDSWKDSSEFSSFRGRIYEARGLVSQMQSTVDKWHQASQAYATNQSKEAEDDLATATHNLQAQHDAYEEIRGEITERLAHGAFFPLFNKYSDNVAVGLKDIAVLSENHAGGSAKTEDPFDSAEMKGAVQDLGEPVQPASEKKPLDQRGAMRAQLFINAAYKPIAPATGIINDEWYLGLKDMADSLRNRLKRAVAVQDPSLAVGTAADMTVSRFVQTNPAGDHLMLLTAADIRDLLNLVDMAEEQADAIRISKLPPPHKSFLE